MLPSPRQSDILGAVLFAEACNERPTLSLMAKQRRRLSFSLRTLLLLVTVFAAWLGWQVHRARQVREAKALLSELEPGPNGLVTKPAGPQWARRFFGEDYFRQVIGVQLSNIGDADVTALTASPILRDITVIDIESVILTDDGLEELLRLLDLEMISIAAKKSVTRHGVERLLRGLPSLRGLYLTETGLTTGDLQELQRIAPNVEISLSP